MAFARLTRLVPTALVLSVGGVLALLLAISLFDYPSADDFCFAVKANLLGYGGAQACWYHNSTGRNASTAAVSA